MPSMHQMQEITPEEKWNAYEARRAARRQLRRGGATVTSSTPKPDPAGAIPAPEEPEKGMMPHPEMPYSLSIDLSGVAAVNEEPYQPAEGAYSMMTMNDTPEWVIKRHLERRFGAIEVEAPIRGDAFVPDKAPELEKTLIDSEEPEWAVKRCLTRQPGMIEVEAPIGRDAFVPGKNLESEGVPINNPDSEEPEWVTKRRTTNSRALLNPAVEPDEESTPGSPGWTTVSYRRTINLRVTSKDTDPRYRHEMTRSRNEPKKSRSGRPQWRGSPDMEISSQAPGMDTGGDQRTRDSISRSPYEGDAREFEERSRTLLQRLRSNPEFAVLSRSETAITIAKILIQPRGNSNKTPDEENDDWQKSDDLQRNEAVDNDWRSRSPCMDHACGDTSIEQSRLLLEVLQKNPAFADLPRNEQRLIFAELLEDEEECKNLLTQSRKAGRNSTGDTLPGKSNDSPTRQRSDTSILSEENLHPRETDEQKRLPELGKNDYWADEPEDDTNPGTVDYWTQLIKNLSREESDEFLDNLLKGTTDDLPEGEFDEPEQEGATARWQLAGDDSMLEGSQDLAQNDDTEARSIKNSENRLSPQEPTSTRNDVSSARLTMPSVTPSQEQPINGTNTTHYEELRPPHDLQQSKTTPWNMVEYQRDIRATGKTTEETEPAAIIAAPSNPPVSERAENDPGRDQNDHQGVPRGCSNPEATNTNASGREHMPGATKTVRNDHASPRHTTMPSMLLESQRPDTWDQLRQKSDTTNWKTTSSFEKPETATSEGTGMTRNKGEMTSDESTLDSKHRPKTDETDRQETQQPQTNHTRTPWSTDRSQNAQNPPEQPDTAIERSTARGTVLQLHEASRTKQGGLQREPARFDPVSHGAQMPNDLRINTSCSRSALNTINCLRNLQAHLQSHPLRSDLAAAPGILYAAPGTTPLTLTYATARWVAVEGNNSRVMNSTIEGHTHRGLKSLW
ncbi:hypothetical protein H4582DRAFT_2066762 [Lactarius indigo]|nr:hypothetical protein H4582DRAFT_2066762 [Lactarius indigo]